jgi:hypothetical protein
MTLGTVKHGVLGGLAGGLVFGVMMGIMGMLPMIGQMAGSPSVPAGFFIHMLISALIGASFAVLFSRKVADTFAALKAGVLYGAAWWVLGPLTLMPLMMGMGVNWNAAAAVQMLPSLLGHVIYGAILGGTYGVLIRTGGVAAAKC